MQDDHGFPPADGTGEPTERTLIQGRSVRVPSVDCTTVKCRWSIVAILVTPSRSANFRISAEPLSHQIGHLRDDQRRNDQRTRMRLKQFKARLVMAIIAIDIGVQRTGVDDQGDDPTSPARISSIRSEMSDRPLAPAPAEFPHVGEESWLRELTVRDEVDSGVDLLANDAGGHADRWPGPAGDVRRHGTSSWRASRPAPRRSWDSARPGGCWLSDGELGPTSTRRSLSLAMVCEPAGSIGPGHRPT